MRWKGRRASANVEDRRGRRGPKMAVGGGLGTLVVIGLFILLGGDPRQLLDSGGLGPEPAGLPSELSPEDEELKQFVSVVLADTETVWREEFRRAGQTYAEPTMVIFSGQVSSGCGYASAQTGPFYCPADQTVYIDLSFFRELRQRFGAPGDFAQAYVIAHEIGHHVQKLLGLSDQVHEARGQVSEEEYNHLSVRLELQADFLAGYWAQKGEEKFDFLEQGDLEEALDAANAIGDDTLQRQAQGYVVPDAFTHGTSAQRVRWFRKGLTAQSLDEGDTFNAASL